MTCDVNVIADLSSPVQTTFSDHDNCFVFNMNNSLTR